jgi:predicted nucleotidyltransferase
MYVVSPDRPLNLEILAILRALHFVAAKLGFSYFLVGATARDVLMSHVFGIEAKRATHDVDFAIALENWHSFDVLKKELIDSGDFEPANSRTHLLYYKPQEFEKAYPLDLIPFGGVEHKRHEIAWPPDMNVVMNVTAYAEALKSALEVDVGDQLVVRVVSIPGLAALKLLAWDDRGLIDSKDAQDLFFLLMHYHEAGNDHRLYDEAFSILEACGFDVTLAGAKLLGHDVRRTLQEHSCQALLAVLKDPKKHDRLVIHMAPRSMESGPETASELLKQFEQGLSLPKL